MKLLYSLFVFICLVVNSISAIEYAYFFPPLSLTGGLGMGYIFEIGSGCNSYDAQGYASIVTYTDNGISLEVYDNYNCKGSAVFSSNYVNGSNAVETIPFNKYDHNKIFVVGINTEPYTVETVMVMQFYQASSSLGPTCTGPPPALKMFINGTFFNSTSPLEECYCNPYNNSPMNYISYQGKTEYVPYPTGCTQYFSKEIFSNFYCRTRSPVPSDYNNSSSNSLNSSSNSNNSNSGSMTGSQTGSLTGSGSGTGMFFKIN